MPDATRRKENSSTSAKSSTEARRVAVIDTPAAVSFARTYFKPQRPVLLRGFLKSWPAFGRWSPTNFAQRFGRVDVQVMTSLSENRPENASPYLNRKQLTMSEFVTALSRGAEAADIYLTAQNQMLRQAPFQELWDEMTLNTSWIDRHLARQRIALWMGPRNVVTPLHYDLQNALLAQVYGSKSVILVSPEENEKLYPGNGGYSLINPERPDFKAFPLFREVTIWKAEIEPGDALYLPYAWWHHVRSLTDSISLSISCFSQRITDSHEPGK